MSTTEKVVVEVVVAAPADEVWRALRDPAVIHRWFGWEYEQITEEIAMIFEAGAVVLEEGRRLGFREAPEPDVFEVEPRGAHTIVRIVRAAPADADWDGIYDGIVEGWRTFLQQLRFMFDRHRDDVRRTLYLEGRAREGGLRPAAALGLDNVSSIAPGGRYQLTTPFGDTLSGEVWFRMAHQLGLTVDSLGDGLLVGHTQQPTPKSPHGGGMAVITTYGLDDAAFDALRARWTSWWESVFEAPTVQTGPHKS